LSDYLSVTKLLEVALSNECCEKTWKPFARQLSLDGELVLVAECEQATGEKRIVGLVIGTIDCNNGYYYRLVVHPNDRNRGIGKALIVALKKKFERRRVSNIMIAVDEHTEEILPWFATLGYGVKDIYAFSKLRIAVG